MQAAASEDQTLHSRMTCVKTQAVRATASTHACS
eukprot:COSAG04_NODE_23759_length_332_cov_7.776824_1_plen_33_part_10